MDESYSDGGVYYPRWLTPSLVEACRDHPVVVLTGARQVGKTTLLRRADPFRSWRFHTMDDFDVLRLARERPEDLWAGADAVVLDEVQKAPELLSAVKLAVDRRPSRRFVLSGSANLLLMRQVSESLAGRAVYFVLRPLAMGEIRGVPPPDVLERALEGQWPPEGIGPEPPDPVPLLLRGFLPPLLHLPSTAWARWWDGYVATYLERDLRQLSQIENLVDFRRLMELLALRSGQILNQSELARDAQMAQATTHRYLSLLETTHLFERLPPFAGNRTARLVKSPKVFWSDPGLAVFLSGFSDAGELRRAREFGGYFECLIYHHLKVLAELLPPPTRLGFWRTRDGKEVDFVLEQGRKVLGLEVKAASRVGYGDAANLRAFLEDHPGASGGMLLYGGSEVRRLGERIVAVPWTMLTG